MPELRPISRDEGDPFIRQRPSTALTGGGTMSRLEFSRKTKSAIIARAAGKCEKCSAVLKPGEGEVDHILPCALGGEPTVANGRLICRVCHVEKSANDIRSIRKADRVRDKSTRAIVPKQKIRSPGFPGSEKSASRSPKPSLGYRALYKPTALDAIKEG